ncbi:hypothetical protein VTO42DRAFT_4481 [Malbranchea cinnamomea]
MRFTCVLLAGLLTGPAFALPGHFQYLRSSPFVTTGVVPQPPLSTGLPGLGPEAPPDNDETAILTRTETITRTGFVPCSTPVASSGTHTWYSTWLTPTSWTTTTQYRATLFPATTLTPPVQPTTPPSGQHTQGPAHFEPSDPCPPSRDCHRPRDNVSHY